MSFADAIPTRPSTASRRKAKERSWMLDCLVSRHLLDLLPSIHPPYLSTTRIDKQRSLPCPCAFNVAQVITLLRANWFQLRRIPANKHRHIVSPRSAAASLPRRDVNVAPIAANAAPIVARSPHCPMSRFKLKWIKCFCRGGFCFRHTRRTQIGPGGGYVQSGVNHRSSGCRNSRKGDGFVVCCG